MGKHERSIARIGGMVANVNNLIRMRVLQVSEDEPNMYLMPEMWYGKDRYFILQFCKNLLTYWHINNQTPHETIKTFTLAVFNKETGDLICTYHMEKGLKMAG